MLILICGLPCTGKSKLSRQLSHELGATWLRSDKFREVMFPDQTRPEAGEQKLYPQSHRIAKNKAMVFAAEILLNEGKQVIIDSNLSSKSSRACFYELASDLNIDLFIIQCSVPEEIAKEWIEKRIEKHIDSRFKIASYEVYKKKKEKFEVFDKEVLKIDMQRPIESVLIDVKNYLGVE